MASERENDMTANGNGNGRTSNRDIWEQIEKLAEIQGKTNVELGKISVRMEPLSLLAGLATTVDRNSAAIDRHETKIDGMEGRLRSLEDTLTRFKGRAEGKLTVGKAGAFVGIVSALVLAAAGVFEIVKGFIQ